MLASFASQYGDPTGYDWIVRAKLVGTHGETSRLLDVIYRAQLAPWSKKKVKSLIPDENHSEIDSRTIDFDDMDDFFGVNRREGESDGVETDDSDSMDEGSAVA